MYGMHFIKEIPALSEDVLPPSIIDPQNLGNMFLQNVCTHMLNYRLLHPRREHKFQNSGMILPDVFLRINFFFRSQKYSINLLLMKVVIIIISSVCLSVQLYVQSMKQFCSTGWPHWRDIISCADSIHTHLTAGNRSPSPPFCYL
jgi:hypothetical protein